MAAAKTALITGATSGIGMATAQILGRQGWNLILLNRNPQKGAVLAQELRKANAGIVVKDFVADLSDLSAVKTTADAIRQEFPSFDVLLNNAGYLPDKIEYVEGIERTLYASHLGHMLLTLSLMPSLKQSPESRVINVSSTLHGSGSVDRFFKQIKGHSAWKAYSDSKLANVLFTIGLTKRIPASMTTYSLHPGVVNTGFGHNTNGAVGLMVKTFGGMLMSPEKGAATSVYLATEDISRIKPYNGRYFDQKRPVSTRNADVTPENAEWLWNRSEELLKGYF